MVPAVSSANSDVPDFIKKSQNKEHNKIEKKEISLLGGIAPEIDKWIGPVYKMGIKILTIIFVAGIIGMSFAGLTKTGHWMKWATGAMLFSFIALLILRLGPTLFLTTNVVGFTLIVNNTVTLLQMIAFCATIGMILTSLGIRKLYTVVGNHPEYYKWSKGLGVAALVLGVLTAVIPVLFDVV